MGSFSGMERKTARDGGGSGISRYRPAGFCRELSRRENGHSIMIRYKGIAFTVYAVTKMARARRFYEKTLGLKPTRVLSKNFVEYDIGPGTLVVASAPKQFPPSKKGTSAALEVRDFPATLAHLKKKKVKIAIGPLDFPRCTWV